MSNRIRGAAIALGIGIIGSGCSAESTNTQIPIDTIHHVDPNLKAKPVGMLSCKILLSQSPNGEKYTQFYPGDDKVDQYLEHVTGIVGASPNNSIMGQAACDSEVTTMVIEEGKAAFIEGTTITESGVVVVRQDCAIVGVEGDYSTYSSKNVVAVCPDVTANII